MTNFTRELIYGKRPIHRSNPQPGQSEWYYLDPRGTDRFADMKEIDVESENSLNPYAKEIQNYLYNNDKYNYKKLYGNNPPPLQFQHSKSNGFNNLSDFGTNNRNNIRNNYRYSDYELFLQPYTPSTQDTRYAQTLSSNTITDITTSTQHNSQDAIFDRVFNRTLEEEGGYEDRATHIDTPTNMGFQQSTLDRFKSAHPDLAQGYPSNIRHLTYEQGKQIARKDSFDKYRIGEIQNQHLQETMFDSFFNHSPQAPAYWAQRAINQNSNMRIKEDGILGSQTIKALNNLSQDEIIKVNNAIIDQRQADHEREKRTNPNLNYNNYTKGLPNRFNRFRIK